MLDIGLMHNTTHSHKNQFEKQLSVLKFIERNNPFRKLRPATSTAAAASIE